MGKNADILATLLIAIMEAGLKVSALKKEREAEGRDVTLEDLKALRIVDDISAAQFDATIAAAKARQG
jgi:hypothetical protein